ncbi:MAG: LysM peptidoglycan-binding domain-containing protein [Vibrio sp.]
MTLKYSWALAFLLAGCQTIPTTDQKTEAPGKDTPTVSNQTVVNALTRPDVRTLVAKQHPEMQLAKSEKTAKSEQAVKPKRHKKPVELTPQQQSDLWKRIAMQFTLEVPDEKDVDYYRNWYLKHPEHLKTVSERAKPFLYLIVDRIEDRDLPMELALLPIVESSFDPHAYSYSSAAGLWQFMPGTADHFGLDRNYWYDGRRDVVASTDAALDYMTYLGDRFNGNWEHAIASYNTGEGRVQKEISKNRKLGRSTDFFSLDLPKETRSYVPKLLALADIISNQQEYGIKIPAIPNKAVLAQVNPKEQLDLSLAAKYAGISVSELKNYNPAFNRGASSPNGPYSFLIPANKVDRFNQQARANRGKGIQMQRYQVKSGDTLSLIAKRNGTSAQAIRNANHISGSNIRIGQSLLVPHIGGGNKASASNTRIAKATPQRATQRSQAVAKNGISKTVVYSVRSGDTIGSIAHKFKVKTQEVLAWNGLKQRDYLQLGQKLTLHVDMNKLGS